MNENKTVLYLIRHGESQANERDVFLGHGDLDLTEKGRKQATLTAEYLKGFPLNAIYASDLLRAYHTAEATAKKVGLPIVKDARLREIECGEWDFQTFDFLEKNYAESYSVWRNDVGLSRPDGGESVAELQKRIVDVIQEIAERHVGERVAVFTHATPIRCFEAHCENKTLCEMKDVPWANNASVTEVWYENGKFATVAYSVDSFLGTMRTGLPDNV